jgi:hypothetical protein
VLLRAQDGNIQTSCEQKNLAAALRLGLAVSVVEVDGLGNVHVFGLVLLKGCDCDGLEGLLNVDGFLSGSLIVGDGLKRGRRKMR